MTSGCCVGLFQHRAGGHVHRLWALFAVCSQTACMFQSYPTRCWETWLSLSKGLWSCPGWVPHSGPTCLPKGYPLSRGSFAAPPQSSSACARLPTYGCDRHRIPLNGACLACCPPSYVRRARPRLPAPSASRRCASHRPPPRGRLRLACRLRPPTPYLREGVYFN